MRVHEVDREKPWFSIFRELASFATQPTHAHRGDDAVMQIAAAIVRDDVANTEVIGEPVRFHLFGEDLRWRAELVHRFKFLGQMPFALVCGVVAGVSEHVAERRNLG